MAETPLKNCPFCGSNDVTWIHVMHMPTLLLWYVICNKCHAETGGYDDVDDAIEAWNTRKGDTK